MEFLKENFGDNYGKFVMWFYNQKMLHGHPLSFIEYKDKRIVTVNTIYSIDEHNELSQNKYISSDKLKINVSIPQDILNN